MAHDFNNVLTGIVGYCELALAALPRESPARQEVEQIQRAGTQAMGLVRQLLRFGRRTPAEPRLVDVAEVLRGVGPLLDHLLGGQIELTIAAAEGQLVVIDPTQLEQVVMNLAINARDAMPGGGRLWIEAGPTGADELTLTVRDTGSGIPAEVLPRVFEPLFTTKGSEAGTGLGLATVQEIVRQAGGRVEVESRLGVGTTFRVRLPLARGSDPSGPAMLGA